jgi:hypothetical protein
MTKTSEEAVIAILVARLGGSVTITPREFIDADSMELSRADDLMTGGFRLMSREAPIELVGELANEIEASK